MITDQDGYIDAEPDDLRDAALKFEAVKIRLSQDKDGWLVVLRIHPHDVQSGDIAELLADPVGTRYMIASVRMGDQSQPVMSSDQLEAKRLVKSAAMLCRDIKFQQWLYRTGQIDLPEEDAAAEYVRLYLGLDSRADLKTAPPHVREKFREMRNQFERFEIGP